MKKLIAFLLVLCASLTLFACGGEDPVTPEGYKLASNGEICSYDLYVPETWIVQSDRSDYTIAAVSSTDGCTVSVAKLEDVYAETMGQYWEECKAKFTFLSDFTVTEEGAQVSVGKDGRQGYRYRFSGKYNGTEYAYMQVFFFDSNAFTPGFFCYTYTATAAHFDTHLSLANDILSHFRFH